MRIGFVVRKGDSPTIGSFNETIGHLMYESMGADADLNDSWWEKIYTESFAEVNYIRVSSKVTLDELKAKVIKKAKLRSRVPQVLKPSRRIVSISIHRGEAKTSLVDPSSGKRLKGSGTIAEAGLDDGDVVELSVLYPTMALYLLMPVPRADGIFTRMLRSDLPDEDSRPYVRGVFLYTDEDAELAVYMRTNFNSINVMSGSVLRLFILEAPEREDLRAVRAYWKAQHSPEMYHLISSLRWLSTKPYDKARCYEIARELGVALTDIPCLALFTSSHEDSTIVIPIVESTPQYFRRLMSAISNVFTASLSLNQGERPSRTNYNPEMSEIIQIFEDRNEATADKRRAEARDVYQKITEQIELAQLDASASAKDGAQVNVSVLGPAYITTKKGLHVEENFTFNAQTTFINKPQDTVIRDFQNLYGYGSSDEQIALLEKLEELIRLVLSSVDLNDSSKELTVAKVHNIAREAKAPEPDRSTLKNGVVALKETVSKAADIAAPALSIVAAIMTILSLA